MNQKTNQFLIFFSAILVALIILVGHTNNVKAITQNKTATASPTATTIANSEETDKIESTPSASSSLENIKKIIKDKGNLQKVKGAISQSLNRNFALLGDVTRISGESITVKDRTGTKILPVSEDVLILKDNKKIKIDDIAVDNTVLVLGRNDADIFTPKVVYVFAKSIKPAPQNVYIGIIKKISKTELILSPRNEDSEKTLSIVKNTKFLNDEGDVIKLEAIEQDTTVLISTQKLEKSEEILAIKSLVPVD